MRDGSDLRGFAIAVAVGVAGVGAALWTGRRASRTASPEDGALEIAAKQTAAGDRAGALATLTACVARDSVACRCAEQAGDLAVDLGRYEDAWTVIKWSPLCETPRARAINAESLVGRGRTDEALRAASAVLAQEPDEPRAAFAKAWALSIVVPSPEALALAEAAVRGRRSVPALLLVARLRAKAHDVEGAHTAIAEAAGIDPADSRVPLELGVVEQGEHHYRDAREAYLRALALDPKAADARYRLVVLTHAAHADDEARHHLDELAAIAPNDPRVPALRAELQRK
jgi:tetratricopeptide (TPR) repeat protein